MSSRVPPMPCSFVAEAAERFGDIMRYRGQKDQMITEGKYPTLLLVLEETTAGGPLTLAVVSTATGGVLRKQGAETEISVLDLVEMVMSGEEKLRVVAIRIVRDFNVEEAEDQAAALWGPLPR